jgi:signal transduction histidine kinase
VVDELRTAYPSRRIELECAPLSGLWDRERLEQVFSNLIGNAIHYGLEARPITIQAEQDDDAVRVEVHNDGVPIAEALRSQLFDPFRRGERSSREGQRGLGLGLYISRELVVAHGGDITVQSDALHGTTFRVTLPRISAAPSRKPNLREPALGTPTPGPTRPERARDLP